MGKLLPIMRGRTASSQIAGLSLVLLLMYAVAAVHALEPEVGAPQVLLRLGGLEACTFIGSEAPNGPAIVVSRLDEDSFIWKLLQVPLDGGEPAVIGPGRDPHG